MSATPIIWRVHTAAEHERVYRMLDSDDGRSSFWAESAVEKNGVISFEFINGVSYRSTILNRHPPLIWTVEYFHSKVTFELSPTGDGGTDITLTNTGVKPEDHAEVQAGWLNVLFPLKATVDFGVDLRNHDPERTWDQRFIDQ